MSKKLLGLNFKWILTISIVIGFGVTMGIVLKSYQIKQPYMFYETNEYDFGTLAPKTKIKHSFGFSNLGNRPLVIKEIKVSCGCTLARVDKKLIMPDESASLDLEYIASRYKKRAEYFISVITNEPQNYIHKFCIRANVVPRIEVEPEIIRFGRVENKDLPVRKHIKIHTEKPEDINVRSDSKFLKVQLEKIDQHNYNMFIEITKDVPAGPLSSKLFYDLRGENSLTLQSSVLGDIIGDISVEPSSVFFGVVQSGETARRTVVLNAKEKIKIDRFQLSESLDEVVSVNVKNGSLSPELEVQLKPQCLETGRKRSQKYEGFIRLWVHCFESSSQMSATDSDPCDFTLYKLNVPVLFFLANTES